MSYDPNNPSNLGAGAPITDPNTAQPQPTTTPAAGAEQLVVPAQQVQTQPPPSPSPTPAQPQPQPTAPATAPQPAPGAVIVPPYVDTTGATISPLVSSINWYDPDSEKNIVMDQGRLKAATFGKLIALLTTSSDSNLLHDFILTYRSFATSFDVVDALIKRYESVVSADQKTIWLKLFNVMRHWIDKTWYDFSKDCPALSTKTLAFFEHCIKTNPAVAKVVESVKQILNRKLSGEEKARTAAAVGKLPKSHLPKDPLCPILDIHPEEIARQITLIEWGLWEKIAPWECLGLGWMKKNKEELAPNVLSMIERFNMVSGWVATAICTIEKPKDRTKAIGKFIEIGDHLKKLGNLNGVMEIVSGLNRGPVYRLKSSWDPVDAKLKKMFEDLKSITDRQKNNAAIRKYLKNLNPPCIPYLGMYLTDLTFIEEGNQNVITEHKLINFNKRHQLSEVIRAIQQYQTLPYLLEPQKFIQEKILKAKVILNEDTLYQCSEFLEPRQGHERGPKPRELQLIEEAAAAAAGKGKSKDAGKRATQPAASVPVEAPPPIELEFMRGYPYYEADAASNLLIDPETTSIKGGTLAKIVERLTHPYTPDNNSLIPFLATYRTFATPQELLDLFIARFTLPQPKDKAQKVMDMWKSQLVTPIQLRVFNAVKTWVDRHWHDFEEDPTLKTKLSDWVAKTLSPASPNFGKTLTSAIDRASQGRVLSPEDANAQKPAPKLPQKQDLDPTTATIFDFDLEEIARQLTLLQHKMFIHVRSNECLDSNYRDDDKNTKAPNVVLMLDFFDNTRRWADNEMQVYSSARNSPTATPVVEKLIQVANYCLTLNNLQSMKAIIEAVKERAGVLNDPLLSPQSKQTLNTLSAIFDNENEMRDRLLALSPPCIPPLDYFLNEIAKTEERYGKDMLTDKLINFEKRRVAGEFVARLIGMQKMVYHFEPVQVIQSYLNVPRSPNYIPRSNSVDMSSNANSNTNANANANPTPNANANVAATIAGANTPRVSSVSSTPFGSFGGGGGGSGGGSGSMNAPEQPNTQLKFLLLDMLLNEQNFRNELKDLVKETFVVEVDRMKRELRGEPVTPRERKPLPTPTTSYGSLPNTSATPGGFRGSIPGASQTPAPVKVGSIPPGGLPKVGAVGGPPKVGAIVPPLGGTLPGAVRPANSTASFSVAHQSDAIKDLMNSLKKGPSSNNLVVTPPTSPHLVEPTTPNPQTQPTSPHPVAEPTTPTSSGGGGGDQDILMAKAREILDKEVPGHPLEKWEHEDTKGEIYGTPQKLVVNVVKKDNTHYLCDIRPQITTNDITNLIKIGKLYRTIIVGCALACVLITPNIDPQAEALAQKFKIKVHKI